MPQKKTRIKKAATTLSRPTEARLREAVAIVELVNVHWPAARLSSMDIIVLTLFLDRRWPGLPGFVNRDVFPLTC